jgi:Uncharacterized protein conserved in bacteria (DUF2087)
VPPRNGTAWGIALARPAAQVFDDHCTLRRYLVGERFMSRTAADVYWRAARIGQSPENRPRIL